MQGPLSNLAISASGFVFDPQSGATFTVNETGRVVMEGLRDGLGLAALVERLRQVTDAGDADVERDVLEYARMLRQERLLPADFELEA